MADSNDNGSDLIEVAGLWTNTDRHGKIYLNGKFGNARLLIFPNKYKEVGTKQPDYKMFVAPYKKREEDRKPATGPDPLAQNNAPAPTGAPGTDPEIPF